MLVSQLLSLPADVVVEELLLETQVLTLVLTSTQPARYCPGCSKPSTRVHSRYRRLLADLPCQGRLVRLQIKVRRFKCLQTTCRRTTFAEQFPGLAAAHARRTSRQAQALCEVAFALGGRAGVPLAKKLRLPTSRHTLLRLLRRMPAPATNTPRQVGIDDFAWKKGDHYGTILVDLARHRPVDLLADRSAESVTAWLLAHPGVELISRDQAGSYADAARRGAPKAVQVADRYHLVANLRDALQKLLDRIRDLQFSTRRRPNAVDCLMDPGREKIDPNQSQIRSRIFGLFNETAYLSFVAYFSYSKTRWIAHFLEQYASFGIGFLKSFSKCTDSRPDQIIAEIHDERVYSQKWPRNFYRMSQP